MNAPLECEAMNQIATRTPRTLTTSSHPPRSITNVLAPKPALSSVELEEEEQQQLQEQEQHPPLSTSNMHVVLEEQATPVQVLDAAAASVSMKEYPTTTDVSLEEEEDEKTTSSLQRIGDEEDEDGMIDHNSIMIIKTQQESVSDVASEALRSMGRTRRDKRLAKYGRRLQGHSVRFSKLEIYNHPVILGDNPGSRAGPPLQIDWMPCDDAMTIDVDEYENERPARRSQSEMSIPSFERMAMFQRLGYSRGRITELTRPVNLVRAQRKRTVESLKLQPASELLEKASRKMLNALTLGARKRNERKYLEQYCKPMSSLSSMTTTATTNTASKQCRRSSLTLMTSSHTKTTLSSPSKCRRSNSSMSTDSEGSKGCIGGGALRQQGKNHMVGVDPLGSSLSTLRSSISSEFNSVTLKVSRVSDEDDDDNDDHHIRKQDVIDESNEEEGSGSEIDVDADYDSYMLEKEMAQRNDEATTATSKVVEV